ncbi:alpha/beta hydrolase [Blastomonas sp. AAP53]|uniref:alpha/beta fold hydrolase n=1 Tax=Blastomonas sp. AAP53 TaxID=1248760 RepID=UPI0002FA7E8E|nr:alpha/beta hydrolase [Blastomonas sp. AAP53]
MVRLLRMAAVAATLAATAAQAQPIPDDPYAAAREIIRDANRIVTPAGVQEDHVVMLGGVPQAINIRGADRNSPILLFIHGGPGAVEMPFAWSFQRPWEDFFTVVQWDQRGAGKSYALSDPAAIAPTMTLDRYRDDAIELIELLRKRFGKQRVFVLGHSWGSAVGLSVAIKRPDLLYAYIGMGQAIDFREGERMGMAWTIEQATKAGRMDDVAAIQALKPYPDTGPFTIVQADGWRRYAIRYGSLIANRPELTRYFQTPRLSPEYTPEDRKAWGKGSEFSTATLWPRVADISFTQTLSLKTPVVMLLGRTDYTVPSPLAAQWMERLEAPSKRTIWFEHSSHMPMVEEPGRVLQALIDHVRPFADKD